MKESGPEINEKPSTIKNTVLFVAVFAALLAVSASVGSVMRHIDKPEEKYKLVITPEMNVKLVRQCIDQVVHLAPSSFSKTFYKDCEE